MQTFKILKKASASPTIMVVKNGSEPYILKMFLSKDVSSKAQGLRYEDMLYREKIKPILNKNPEYPFLNYIASATKNTARNVANYLGILKYEEIYFFTSLYIFSLDPDAKNEYEIDTVKKYFFDKNLSIDELENIQFDSIMLPFKEYTKFTDRLLVCSTLSVVKYVKQLINAVHKIYINDLVHNDLHSDNIMIENNTDSVLIFDWDRGYTKGIDNPQLNAERCYDPDRKKNICSSSQCNILKSSGYCTDLYKSLHYVFYYRNYAFKDSKVILQSILKLDNSRQTINSTIAKLVQNAFFSYKNCTYLQFPDPQMNRVHALFGSIQHLYNQHYSNTTEKKTNKRMVEEKIGEKAAEVEKNMRERKRRLEIQREMVTVIRKQVKIRLQELENIKQELIKIKKEEELEIIKQEKNKQELIKIKKEEELEIIKQEKNKQELIKIKKELEKTKEAEIRKKMENQKKIKDLEREENRKELERIRLEKTRKELEKQKLIKIEEEIKQRKIDSEMKMDLLSDMSEMKMDLLSDMSENTFSPMEIDSDFKFTEKTFSDTKLKKNVVKMLKKSKMLNIYENQKDSKLFDEYETIFPDINKDPEAYKEYKDETDETFSTFPTLSDAELDQMNDDPNGLEKYMIKLKSMIELKFTTDEEFYELHKSEFLPEIPSVSKSKNIGDIIEENNIRKYGLGKKSTITDL